MSEELTPRIYYVQATESSGDGACTLALKPMSEVNLSPKQRVTPKNTFPLTTLGLTPSLPIAHPPHLPYTISTSPYPHTTIIDLPSSCPKETRIPVGTFQPWVPNLSNLHHPYPPLSTPTLPYLPTPTLPFLTPPLPYPTSPHLYIYSYY